MIISFSCMANIQDTIKAYNHKMLNNKQNECYCNCASSCKYPMKKVTADIIMFARIQLYLNLRQGFTSVHANIYPNVTYMKFTLRFQSIYVV